MQIRTFLEIVIIQNILRDCYYPDILLSKQNLSGSHQIYPTRIPNPRVQLPYLHNQDTNFDQTIRQDHC